MRNILRTAAVSGLIFTGVARGAESYRLEYAPLRDIEATDGMEWQMTGMIIKEWMCYQLLPPATQRQKITMTMEPGGQQGADESVNHWPLVFTREIYPSPRKDVHFFYKVHYKGTLYTTDLVPVGKGEAAPKVAPLSARERQLFLIKDAQVDFDSPEVQGWLDAAKVRRKSGERDLDFAKRAFLAFSKDFKWNADFARNGKASEVCRDKKAVCGGLSTAFAAVLRANGIPTRITSLYLVNQEMKGPMGDIGHANNEFFADGIGWVPCDLTGGCSAGEDEATQLSYFGHDSGDYLVLDYGGEDVVVDTATFGSGKPAPNLSFRDQFPQRIDPKVTGLFSTCQQTGSGPYDNTKNNESWDVHTTPNPEAKEMMIDPEGDPGQIGFPAHIKLFHDDQGWHVQSGTDGSTHKIQMRIAPEYGAIESFAVNKGKKETPKVPTLLALGYSRAGDFTTDFTVSPSTRAIRFLFWIDGKEDPYRVFIGKGSKNPHQVPFVIPTAVKVLGPVAAPPVRGRGVQRR